MPIDWIINAFTTLAVIIDPVGLAPIFLVLTHGMTKPERRLVAIRASLTACGILVAFAFAGAALLNALGITLSAFRIAGGLLLFWTAFEMIFEKRLVRKKHTAEQSISKDHIRQIAVFPLAIPLMSGPGAISATVLLASNQPASLNYGLLILTGIIGIILALCFFVFELAEKIDPLLGETGRTIMERLLRVLLAALSVQFVVDGITALIKAA